MVWEPEEAAFSQKNQARWERKGAVAVLGVQPDLVEAGVDLLGDLGVEVAGGGVEGGGDGGVLDERGERRHVRVEAAQQQEARLGQQVEELLAVDVGQRTAGDGFDQQAAAGAVGGGGLHGGAHTFSSWGGVGAAGARPVVTWSRMTSRRGRPVTVKQRA